MQNALLEKIPKNDILKGKYEIQNKQTWKVKNTQKGWKTVGKLVTANLKTSSKVTADDN